MSPILKRLLRALLTLVILLPIFSAPRPAVALPSGFTDVYLGEVHKPTAMAFTPDGRLILTQEEGEVRIYQDGIVQWPPALKLYDIHPICINYERGLLGVAVDPDFVTNHYIYLYYTLDRVGDGLCSTDVPATDPINRVARFTLQADNTINPVSEVVILDNILSTGGFHNAGDMHFGLDGYLYISVGDSTNRTNAQRKYNLSGKILRIASNGTPAPGNPFYSDPGSQRCGDADGSISGGPCQEIFAMGLRNPFRFTFRPGSNEFYINDVGQDTWEEIDVGQSGANYGWPCREGAHDANNQSTVCNPPPPNMTDPIFEYQHGTTVPGTGVSNCHAITGGAFVPDGVWPGYDDVYLFSDYVCDTIFSLWPDGSGGYTVQAFASLSDVGSSGPTHLLFGPFGNSEALYYGARGTSDLRRVTDSQAPTAVISANPIYGSLPLTVTLSASGSADPGGGPLTFDWDFGDGSPLITGTTSITTTHTYTSEGVYTATLVTRNGANFVSDPARIQVYPGKHPPTPVINSPSSGAQFSVGQAITMNGSATDPEDPASTLGLSWNAVLWHVDQYFPAGIHNHPLYLMPPITSSNGVLTITIPMPPPEGMRATVYSFVEIQFTATDPWGLSTTVTRTVQPKLVNVTFGTQPTGLELFINDVSITGTQTLASWQDYALNVTAQSPQADSQGQKWAFSSWSDGGAPSHSIITPSSPATYTATFSPALFVWLSTIFK